MFTLNCRGKLLVIDQPIVMGIINSTPDSFFEQSRQQAADAAVQQAQKFLQEGAVILDVGGQSTRPGAQMVGAAEETDRVVPIIQAIHQQFPEAFISVDTFHASVAEAAARVGASIINDVSAGSMDANMLATAAKQRMPYIAMHNRGIPATKDNLPPYEDVALSVLDFFVQKLEECMVAGIHDVLVDPGFGFGKTVDENFELLEKIGLLQMLGKPILLGVSRKSSIYKTLGITPQEALNGTTVLHTIGLRAGAHILRVHDVKEAMEVIKLLEKLKQPG